MAEKTSNTRSVTPADTVQGPAAPAIRRWLAEFKDPVLEVAFLQRYGNRARRHIGQGILATSLLVVLCGVLDPSIVGEENFHIAYLIRAGNILVLFMTWLALPHKPSYAHVRNAATAVAIATAVAVFALIQISQPDGQLLYYSGLNLIIVGMLLYASVQFRVVFAICAAIVLAYFVQSVFLLDLQASYVANNMYFLTSIFLLASMSSNSMHIRTRQHFFRRYILEQREQELIRSKAEAEQANKAKTEFLARMSHELRNPLSGVIASAGVARLNITDPQEVSRSLDHIGRSGDVLKTLIGDLLDLSVVEGGHYALRSEAVDLRQIIDDALTHSKAAIGHRPVTLNAVISPEVPERLQGDAVRLFQIISIVVSNAVKFTDRGAISIAVSVVERTDRDIRLRCVVTDTGSGIADDDLQHVFESGFRGKNAIHADAGGTGLGLSIARALVQAMDGEIDAESVAGSGTRVKFHIRLGLPGPAAAARAEFDPLEVEQIGHLTLLVVEDDDVNRTAITKLVASWGWQFEAVASGREGIAIANAGMFDAIVLDMRLPDMHGMEVIAAVRQEAALGGKRVPPVIALTANVAPADVDAYFAAGAWRVVAKPFEPSALQRAIVEAVRRRDAAPAVPAPVRTSNEDVLDRHKLNSLQRELGERNALQLLAMFSDSLSARRDAMHGAFAIMKWDAIRDHAHAIAGTAGAYAFPRLQRAAKALEDSIVDGAAAATEPFDLLTGEANAALRELGKLLGRNAVGEE